LKNQEISANRSDNTSNVSAAHEGGPKRRGRKREKHDTYIQKAERKILEIKEKLKTAKATGISVKER